jgi:hypothetical protein
MSSERTHATPQKSEARPVAKPGDRHEREAERAGDVVARGGTVAGWSFTKVPATPVQRQEMPKEKSDDEKKKEALTKAGEAALETPQAKAVKEKVLADPLVKTVKDAVTSTPGLIATGAVAAGGVAALGAAKKPLPFQPPAIPLDKITPGLSAEVKYEGPVNAPTFVGLSLTYKEQGPKGKPSLKSDDIAKETAALKAQQQMFKPTGQKAAEKAEDDAAVQAYIRSQKFTIPLTPGAPATKQEDAPKKEEDKPVQPAPASPSAAPPAHANVDGALANAGRPLEPGARRSMEARFGRDFSNVRVHDDARAAATAASIDAAAFTVGEDVVFAPGRYDPSGDEGRRLLAHELTHVVQQGEHEQVPGGAGQPLDRKLRAYFEPRLGFDLSRVRTHTGAEAAESAKRVRARAYTVGSDVVFGRNQYEPETQRGRWLVAHELAHVAQAGRASGVAGTKAVERDASAAATAAVTGKAVRIGARRSGVELHKFGEPDHPPDLTFVSTHGTPGFLNDAVTYHQNWGLNPQRFNSMQGLLATLARSTGSISRLRIVSHANFDNLFTPLFDGGSAGIADEDLLAFAESDPAGLRRTLGPPLFSSMQRQILTAAQATQPAVFQAFGIDPAHPPTTGPAARLIDASVDLLGLRRSPTGGPNDIPADQRATLITALTAELNGLRPQVQAGRAAAGSTAPVPTAQDLQSAITGVTGFNFTAPAQDAQFIAGVRTATAAVAAGFRRNLDAVRARLSASSWIDLRGCRVGQRTPYLTAVARFFGTAQARPNVSGPEWWQSYPTLGAQNVDDRGLPASAADADVQAALQHWSQVTGVHDRFMWWLRFLGRVLQEEALRLSAPEPSLLTPPSLRGGLHLDLDPLLLGVGGDLPLRALPSATLTRRPPARSGLLGRELQNPLLPMAQREIPRLTAPEGELRYYLESNLPLPVQSSANLDSITLLLKLGRERAAMDAWLASEWAPAAPGLAALQRGAWSTGARRMVEALSDETPPDAPPDQRATIAKVISPDPLYAMHIKTT